MTAVRLGRADRRTQDRILARVRDARGSLAQIAADEGLPVDLVETMVDVWARAGLVHVMPAVEACATCAMLSGAPVRAEPGAAGPGPHSSCDSCPLAAMTRR